MITLPTGTVLGELTLCSTFVFFDIPRLFTCGNRAGATFLALSTADDENMYEWLYLPMSNDRLGSLLEHQMPLRDAFLSPEDGYLFKVSAKLDGTAEVTHIFPEQVPESDLPESSALLVGSPDAFIGAQVVAAQEAAIRSRRETYNVHLYPRGTALPEVDVAHLGGVLTGLQELTYAVGQYSAGNPTLRGVISGEILDETTLQVTQMFSGSFGIQLKSRSMTDLFGNSLISDALQEITNLLRLGSDEGALSVALHKLKGRVASKYRKFIGEVQKVRSPIKVEWGSPRRTESESIYLTKETIDEISEIVQRIDIELSEAIQFEAELLGLDVETKNYRVRHLKEGAVYSGKISEEAFVQVRNSRINGVYQATVKKIVETNSLSGAESIKWMLIGLKLSEE